MNTAPIISKVWNFCTTLRDDGASIAKNAEYIFSMIDHQEMMIDSEITRANVLRQSILKKAFSGKLVEQDLNDEPASVLLERIKAEKAKQAPKKKPRKRKATTSSTRRKRTPA